MSLVSASLGTVVILVLLAGQGAPPVIACTRCGWKPPAGARNVRVSNIDELERALNDAHPGDAVLLANGDYPIRRMLDIRVPNVTLRGEKGDPTRVVLHGRGMTGDNVGVAVSVSAPDVTIADVTIRDVGYHAIQVRGELGASRFTLHNARLADTGQQLLKGSFANNGQFADQGLVACSDFSYTTSAPSDYTNGVDIIGARAWQIRDNRFTRIRGPEARRWRSGPTILAWGGSADTIVERNLIIDSFRGIALGLAPGVAKPSRNIGAGIEHQGGLVRNNAIVNLNPWADEGIEINAARDARVEQNTVLVEGTLAWSISLRFAPTSARVTNNLTSREIRFRDNGLGVLQGNAIGAARDWFVDAPRGDMRMTASGKAKAGNAGVVDWRFTGR